MAWDKSECGQASVIYKLDNPYWIQMCKLADTGRGFQAPKASVFRLLLEERLRLVEAGWQPYDEATESILCDVCSLSSQDRASVARYIKDLAPQKASRKAKKGA